MQSKIEFDLFWPSLVLVVSRVATVLVLAIGTSREDRDGDEFRWCCLVQLAV